MTYLLKNVPDRPVFGTRCPGNGKPNPDLQPFHVKSWFGSRTNKDRWVIYALTYPCTGVVRYVGYTTQHIFARLWQHIKEAIKSPGQNAKTKWIHSLLEVGLEPWIYVVEYGTGHGWVAAERWWVDHFKSRGVPLTNINTTGIHKPGHRQTDTARKKLSESAKKRWASMTAEEKQTALTPLLSALTSADRSRNILKYERSLTRAEKENRSTRGTLRELNRTPEERAAICAKISHAIRRHSPAERSVMAKHASLSRSPEKRRADASKAATSLWANMTPEQKTALFRKRSANNKQKIMLEKGEVKPCL